MSTFTVIPTENVKRFVLPISPNYVAHWGLWEATREVLQNAYDERTRNQACVVTFDHDEDMGRMVIGNSTGTLTKATMILGNSDKTGDEKLRGKFGEGYKLALLVFLRLGHEITIHVGHEIWSPKIVFDEEYGAKVLAIEIREGDKKVEGVQFTIYGIDFNKFQELSENIYGINQDKDFILEDPGQKGRIYVGGLFVTQVKEYACGYHFSPAAVKLDRDRGMVDNYNLGYATSKLWAQRLNDPTLIALMMDRAPDVYYVASVGYDDKLAQAVASEFRRMHGETAIPVQNQVQLEEAQAAGRKAVMVPENMRTLIGRVMSLKIPKTGTPAQRLKKLINENYFSQTIVDELNDIIAILEGKVAEGDK